MSDTFEPIPVPDIPLLPSEQTKYKITAPIGIIPVYQFFGVAPQAGRGFDVAYLLSNAHGKFNPASKIKPVRRDTPKALSGNPADPDDFKGTQTDFNNGIYYGVRCRFHQGALNWGDMHKCNWEYLPPRPGTDYCRMSDLNGYNHRCEFNPKGSIMGVSFPNTLTLYYDAPENLNVGIACQTVGDKLQDGTITQSGNTTINPDYVGVNLQDIAGAVYANNVPDLGKWYPCILISNATDAGEPAGGHYVRALAANNNTDVTKRYQPLRNSSNAWQGSYVAETLYELNGDIVNTSTGLPQPTAPCKKIATLFITDKIYGTGTTDLTHWVNVSEGLQLQQSRFFTIPLGAGIILNYKRKYAQGLYCTGAYTMAAGLRVVVAVNFDWVIIEPDNKPDRETTYSVNVQLYDGADQVQIVGSSGFSVQGRWAYDTPGQNDPIPLLTVMINTDLVSSGIPGTWSHTFSYYWNVKSDKSADRILNSGSGTVTYTSN